MIDRETNRPRGFGFVTFEDDACVERALAVQPLLIEGKEVSRKTLI